jgi:hypothetical protein
VLGENCDKRNESERTINMTEKKAAPNTITGIIQCVCEHKLVGYEATFKKLCAVHI